MNNTNDIATHRNDSRITRPIASLNVTATLAQISETQRAWLAANGFTLHTDEHGNVSATKPGKAIGSDSARWVLTENRQLWEVSADHGYFVSELTGRFHVSLVSEINGAECVYDAAAGLTLRAALQMVQRFTSAK